MVFLITDQSCSNHRNPLSYGWYKQWWRRISGICMASNGFVWYRTYYHSSEFHKNHCNTKNKRNIHFKLVYGFGDYFHLGNHPSSLSPFLAKWIGRNDCTRILYASRCRYVVYAIYTGYCVLLPSATVKQTHIFL